MGADGSGTVEHGASGTTGLPSDCVASCAATPRPSDRGCERRAVETSTHVTSATVRNEVAVILPRRDERSEPRNHRLAESKRHSLPMRWQREYVHPWAQCGRVTAKSKKDYSLRQS